MRFVTVTPHPDIILFLYDLLKERTPDQSISHRRMPSFADHWLFVFSAPYEAWYILDDGAEWMGSIYLTRQDEIGIHLRQGTRHKGLGSEAITLLMKNHPRKRYLANINPANETSIAFFEKHGFSHIQNTYELRP